MSRSSAELLAALVRTGRPDALAGLAGALESRRIGLDASPVAIQAIRGIDGDFAAFTYRTFDELAADLDATAVATAIRTAIAIRIEEHLTRPQVQVTWTGPEAEGALVVPTRRAVERMLDEVRPSGEILLVGYSITVSPLSFMAEIRNILEKASKEKKVLLTVVTDEDWDERNTHRFLDGWDVFARRPRVYTWAPEDPAYPYTKMHAKCLVVDRLQLLVGSANFTQGGLDGNLELGLLVRNQPVAAAVHDRFQTLINTGALKELAK